MSDEFAGFITIGMQDAANVFCDFQDQILKNPKLMAQGGGRLLADYIACGMYWSAALGLDAGMGRLGFP